MAQGTLEAYVIRCPSSRQGLGGDDTRIPQAPVVYPKFASVVRTQQFLMHLQCQPSLYSIESPYLHSKHCQRLLDLLL